MDSPIARAIANEVHWNHSDVKHGGIDCRHVQHNFYISHRLSTYGRLLGGLIHSSIHKVFVQVCCCPMRLQKCDHKIFFIVIQYAVDFRTCPTGAHYIHGKVERKIQQIKKSMVKEYVLQCNAVRM